MKKSDFFFWGILAVIALFLVLKGNDMHREYYDYLKQKVSKPNTIEETKELK